MGYGLGGSAFHAPLIATTPGLSLAAVVTSDPGRAAAVKDRYPGTAVVPGVERLLAGDPAGDVDLVVVSVPNARHREVAEAAIEAGLAVVVDKPVTPTVADALHLARLAAERGVSIIAYHNRRWDGDFLTVRHLTETGRLGQVWRFESRFERWKPVPATGTWKQDPAQPGGGILYDLGTHLVDQALTLFGPPESVYAEISGRRSALDDDAFVALRYPGGPAVHLWASSQAAQLGPRFRVLGSDGGYVKYGMDPQEDALRSGRSPTDDGWGEEPPAAWGRLGSVEGTEAVPTRPGAYPSFYAGVAAHLLEGAPAPVDFADAVAGLAVLEAALESARTGAVVPAPAPAP